MNILDLSNTYDFIVTDLFPDIESFFLDVKTTKLFKQNVKQWKKYVKSRMANFVISRRFDLSAPGTMHLAWFSATPITGQNLWSIQGIPADFFIPFFIPLLLWFNSSINLLQLYLNRTETRGAWMELNEYGLKELLILNPETLTDAEKQKLLNIFSQIKEKPFPDILTQLKQPFAPRIEIDKTMLEVLGFKKEEIEEILNSLYPLLANEIEQLKALMKG